jgi:hypothetical protein
MTTCVYFISCLCFKINIIFVVAVIKLMYTNTSIPYEKLSGFLFIETVDSLILFFAYVIMDDLYSYIDIGAGTESLNDDPMAYYLGYYD